MSTYEDKDIDPSSYTRLLLYHCLSKVLRLVYVYYNDITFLVFQLMSHLPEHQASHECL